MEERRDIKSLSHRQLGELMRGLEQPAFRATQLERWIYANGCVLFDDMTDLPSSLRSVLAQRFFISAPKLVAKQVSSDGTRKYALELADGAIVETVGIPSEDGSRLTVCFSSQVGCPMGCTFCATGRSGFTRNLTSGEMLDQVRFVMDDFGRRVTNVVCMGQGEPFLNYDAVIEALGRMNSSNGLGIGARHITVSTCGLVDGIRRFEDEPEQYTLAISLHSAIQETRDELMPGTRGIPLEELRDAIKGYGDTTKRRPSLEYALIKDVNDDDEHIEALIAFCRGMLCHVNLIPLNQIGEEDGALGMMEPSPRLQEVADMLTARGVENSVRHSRGSDIDGACGQLRRRLGSSK